MARYMFLLWLMLPLQLIGKVQGYIPYEWDEDRARYVLSKGEEGIAEYILKQHAQYDYVLENNQFMMYVTVHRIIRVNNSEAIQRHNRIYISMRNSIDLVELKARSINQDGKVVNFDVSNLKELKDEETGSAYRIFAIEGVEQGSEVEYYYILKRFGSLYDRVFMQYEMPVRESSFRLTCPEHLRFDFASYNGYGDVEEEVGEIQTTYQAVTKNIEGLRRENFSAFDANRQRIEFKLAYNTAKSETRMFTWDEAAKTFYQILTTLDKADKKALGKFVRGLNDKAGGDLNDRVEAIEKKIKTMVRVDTESRAEAMDDLTSILKYKLASREGVTKLFLQVFDAVGITCYPVMTCNRHEIKFDETFDSWAYLNEYLLYFPDTGEFLVPYAMDFRYPLIPPDVTAQKGLFIEPFEVGAVKSALSSIQDIPPAAYVVNSDSLDMQVLFMNRLDGNEIHMHRSFGGCNATLVSPYYDVVGEADRARLIEDLVKQTAPDAAIEKWDAGSAQTDENSFFKLTVDFRSNHFIETAGARVLFKVGQLIGPQLEMYRDDQRMTAVENDFNRCYARTIRVEIPTGYEVRNPEDIKIEAVYKGGEKHDIPFQFISDYTMQGNIMVIRIVEYYKEIYAPLARYEDYRTVVNAAADFNKVTLVLEKK